MKSPVQRSLSITLLTVGMALACVAPWTDWPKPVLLVAFGILCVVAFRSSGLFGTAFGRILARHNTPPFHLKWQAFLVFVGSFMYLYLVALLQGRDMFPRWHDHQMTWLQATMLWEGRLWLPQHPLADFFETFYVFTKPVYAAIYFPGTALALIPFASLGLSWWLGPLLFASATATLVFVIVADLFSVRWAVGAVLLLLGCQQYRHVSVLPTSHQWLVVVSLAAMVCWLRWRRQPSVGWVALAGALSGWAAITRPIEAIALLTPLAAAWTLDLLQSQGSVRRAILPTARSVLIASACALPFIFLQLVLDRGVSGTWLKTPITAYTQAEFPAVRSFGGQDIERVLASKPTSVLGQKRAFYDVFVKNLIDPTGDGSVWSQTRIKCETVIRFGVATPIVWVFVALGLLNLNDRRRLVVAGGVFTFVTLYLFYPTVLPHYTVAIMPALIVLAIAGLESLLKIWPNARREIGAVTFVFLLLVPFASLPGVTASKTDDSGPMPTMRFNYLTLPTLVQTPAVVLYTWRDGLNFHEEPVYNIDVAWPDDAPIIRAHDLGERNIELFQYYAKLQPERNIYTVDRGTAKLTYLGTARELVSRGAGR